MNANPFEQHRDSTRETADLPGYPAAELARAFTTALTHADPAVRERAEARVDRWRSVLAGMADGTLAIGSRTPVAGLPAWVTPKVVRGGFATGQAAAGGPLRAHETDTARRAGMPAADRRALFAHFLTGPGLAELDQLLHSGTYEIEVPEEAALLTVAWLAGQGDALHALDLLDTLEPFAGQLRFTPRPTADPGPEPGQVHRSTVGEVREALAARRPQAAVEAMNEALTIWAPFADELLDHWLRTAENGRVMARTADATWYERGAALLERYQSMAAAHTRCGKHRRPKENLFILRTALEETLDNRALDARRLGLLQHAVHTMVARRGAPGTTAHTALRARQAADAARPTHHAMAQLVVRRLSGLPQDTGTPDTDNLTRPVTAAEHRDTGLPQGATVPEAIARTVRSALSADIVALIKAGVVPSVEVLAELVPQLVRARHRSALPGSGAVPPHGRRLHRLPPPPLPAAGQP